MSIMFQTDMSGIANGTNFATQFSSYWSLVSGEAKIYNEALRNGTYGGGLLWLGSDLGINRAFSFKSTMNSVGSSLSSTYIMYGGTDATNMYLRHLSGNWVVTKGFANIIQVADSEAHGVRDIIMWVEPLSAPNYRVHLSIDGVEYTADISDSTWSASTQFRLGNSGSTDWAYFDDIKIATNVADLQTSGGGGTEYTSAILGYLDSAQSALDINVSNANSIVINSILDNSVSTFNTSSYSLINCSISSILENASANYSINISNNDISINSVLDNTSGTFNLETNVSLNISSTISSTSYISANYIIELNLMSSIASSSSCNSSLYVKNVLGGRVNIPSSSTIPSSPINIIPISMPSGNVYFI